MDKVIRCKDLGSDCTFSACAGAEAELFEKVVEQGRSVRSS